MKTVFITIYDGAVSKGILRTSIFSALKQSCRIVLIVHPQKLEYYREAFGGEAEVESIPSPTWPRLEHYFSRLALYSLPTATVFAKILYGKKKNARTFPYIVQYALWILGHLRWFRVSLRQLYRIIPDRSFDPLFSAYNPSLVFTPNMVGNDDHRLIKAAQKRGIPSVGMPKGFDNITSKSFFSSLPDTLIVQTEIMKGHAIHYMDLPQHRIRVAGFPQFDLYKSAVPNLDRTSFCNKLGLDPKKPFILYAAAGDQIAPHDEEVLNLLIEAVNSGAVRSSPQILVRPHPKYAFRTETIKKQPFVIIERPGSIVGPNASSWEFDNEDILFLKDSLLHASVIIHSVSTLAIEAAILDRPNIGIAFDGEHQLDSELRLARYYTYEHYRAIISSGATKVACNFLDLIAFLNDYIAHPEIGRHERRTLLSLLGNTFDGKSGKRVAKIILGHIS